jgi:uncharacterized protein YbbK (DUF523 family)
MIKVLVSACLLGEPVRYHGGHARCSSGILSRWQREGRLVSVCPEVAGGLGAPRPAAEIVGESGAAVLDGVARIVDTSGYDATGPFLAGARLALQAAQTNGVQVAILKDGSPSCGSRFIYDGTFTGTRRQGTGVTAALLRRAGVRVFSETDIEAADAWIKELEAKS